MGSSYQRGLRELLATISPAIPTFLDCWIVYPSNLISDNEFAKQTFQLICDSLHKNHRPTPFYNVWNALFGLLKRLLRAVTFGLSPKAWCNWLASGTFAHNITVNETKGLTHFEFLHGWSPIIPLSMVVGLPEPQLKLARTIAIKKEC